jgi:hypothetical protein
MDPRRPRQAVLVPAVLWLTACTGIVALASGDEGVMVFLDATDGTICDVSSGIVN